METTFLATSEKLWHRLQHLGGPRNSAGMNRRKNASIASRPSLVRRSPRAPRGPPADRERMDLLRRSSPQLRQAVVAHQHQEAVLGKRRGGGRVEAEGPFSMA